MMKEITVNTSRRNEFVVLDQDVQQAVSDSDVKDGCAVLFCPHTTAALTINENADPSVVHDILTTVEKLVPERAGYSHSEGNSDAHIKASLFGVNLIIPIVNGRISLGTWQGIFFCEFDGPRRRKVHIQIIGA
jgi:secondary thiamine-phosphate synthase enzyme